MKKIGMVLLLWMIGVTLAGCSKADWYVISSYQQVDAEASEKIAPFEVDKEGAGSYEFLLSCFDWWKKDGIYIDFQEEDFKDINEEFFKEYNILSFNLHLNQSEEDRVSLINLSTIDKTLHITIHIEASRYLAVFGHVWTYFVAVKRSILDDVDKVELDIYNPYYDTKGSYYHIYE